MYNCYDSNYTSAPKEGMVGPVRSKSFLRMVKVSQLLFVMDLALRGVGLLPLLGTA